LNRFSIRKAWQDIPRAGTLQNGGNAQEQAPASDTRPAEAGLLQPVTVAFR